MEVDILYVFYVFENFLCFCMIYFKYDIYVNYGCICLYFIIVSYVLGFDF